MVILLVEDSRAGPGLDSLLTDIAPRLVRIVLLSIVRLIVEISGTFSNFCTPWPVVGFHSLTVQSSDAEASSEPSGENATALTQLVWPSSFCTSWPVAGCHSLTSYLSTRTRAASRPGRMPPRSRNRCVPQPGSTI